MFIEKNKVLDAISQGIIYLSNQQKEDGSFFSLSSPKSAFSNALIFNSTFSTSLILDSLNNTPQTPSSEKIKNQASSFLLKQKSVQWSYNYWVRNSDQAKTLPYPDDLDDTSCALAALFHYDKTLIDGSVLAYIVQLLTATEVTEGGPYRTWLVPDSADKVWKDVDIAVNSNIAYFLSLLDISLPNLTGYVEDCIEQNKLVSPYYPTNYPILYFLSRFYKGEYKEKLIKILLAKMNGKGTWDNPLNTALAMSAICNLQEAVELLDKSILFLLQTQINGSWKPYPFYTGVNPKRDKGYFAGSAALTTAFCLEALNKYLYVIDSLKRKKTQMKVTKMANKTHRKIMQKVEKRLLLFDSTTYAKASSILNEIVERDTQQQITLLPYYFVQSLGDKKTRIQRELLIHLGIANVFGWLAYTIYDDFFDGEGDPQLLSIANISMRSLCEIYEKILSEKAGFVELFHKIMDNLDKANAWEVTNCKIPIDKKKFEFKNFVIPNFQNYEILAEKSLGHALGPLAILFSFGFEKNSPEVKNILVFFKHYLIVRQLNDDAHDWKEDFSRGYCNSVGSLLMKRNYPGRKKVSVEKYLQNLQKVFWYEVIDDVCALVYAHTKKARIALKKCPVVSDDTFFEALLVKYEKAAQLALEEKKKALLFLQTMVLDSVSF